ncbi:MAG: hypothetical protein N5P05_001451 [Chroococcopsis gigantea SAG 12.99]|nr:hypothetical protein [Chroococcopsis gigantea SAG 12.99]
MGTQDKLVIRSSPDEIKDKTKGVIVPLWKNLRTRLTWQHWAILSLLLLGGVGGTATLLLFNWSKSSNCPAVFWPLASASTRFYCAQLEANTRTVDGLLKAINLVTALPPDHPLRAEMNPLVEQWAEDIFNLAEKDFQAGNIEKAIATVKKIPQDVSVAKLVDEQIQKWRDTWKKGEEIFVQLEEHLRQSHWNHSFRLAVDLLNLDNQYWATTKYNEAIAKINLAQVESAKLDKAYAIFNTGGISNWIQTIIEANKIGSESYAYQEAQRLVKDAEEKIRNYAQGLIDNKNWPDLKNLVALMPEKTSMTADVGDWSSLADAGIDGTTGTTDSIKAAILSAQQIAPERPLYTLAQDLIGRWNLELKDLEKLEIAQKLAIGGAIKDLQAAIKKAQEILSGHPRYNEAQGEINRWVAQIQVIEDKPFLDQARESALPGDIDSLKSAINTANKIGPNRALYSEAQRDVGNWWGQIQRIEDQPILDQAQALANVKDYSTAIETARRIGSGRTLYYEARNNVRQWRRQLNAQQDLQQAGQLAQSKLPDNLIRAIGIARNIPRATDAGMEKGEAIDRWSFQLLALATDQGNNGNYTEAIRLAENIPSESSAYSSARSQIEILAAYFRSDSPPPFPKPRLRAFPKPPPAAANEGI